MSGEKVMNYYILSINQIKNIFTCDIQMNRYSSVVCRDNYIYNAGINENQPFSYGREIIIKYDVEYFSEYFAGITKRMRIKAGKI